MQKTRKEKIPVTIITGFLGSGKTSLLTHLLKNSGGKKIAVLINEFGSLGMDEAIVASQCDDACRPTNIIELANGCICCTVADDFLPAMKTLLARQDDLNHIIIETSGLALPKPLLKAFQWPDIKTQTTVDGVIAVLDGPAILAGLFQDNAPKANNGAARGDGFKQDHENEVAELFEDQLLSADMVVINKCDLLRAADIDAISRDLTSGKIEGLRPAAKILTASHGQVSPALLLGIDQSVEDDLDNRKSHHDDEGEEEHGHDEFHSFVATFGAVADEKKLENVIDQLIKEHAVLRMKGLVARVGKPHKEIWQVVGPRIEHYFTTAPHNHDDSQLVVIGLKGLDEAAIKEQLLAAAA